MERLRRTMLFVPGNNPGLLRDAHIYGSDSIMFDLEDSVSVTEKDAARLLVFHAARTIDYGKVEKVVRVNPLDTEFGQHDIEAMVRARIDVIRLPKTETADDILKTEAAIAKAEKAAGIEVGTTKMMAAIEGPLGVINAYAIATATPRLIGIAIGAEDYAAGMKTKRSVEGTELLYARSAIVVAARAAGIDAIDTVFGDLNDTVGFENEVKLIKQLGFDGKSVINPRQIGPIHAIFTPTEKEIAKAITIVDAMEQALKAGVGVISLNGRMIDKPVLTRAQRILQMAEASGVYFPDKK